MNGIYGTGRLAALVTGMIFMLSSLGAAASPKVVVVPLMGEKDSQTIDSDTEQAICELLEINRITPPPALNCPTPAKLVFATSKQYQGNLGGIAGADDNCNELWQKAHPSEPGRIFKAWISDGIDAPIDTFNKSKTGYRRVDGVRVADSWSDLTDGTINDTIDVDEEGGRLGWANDATGNFSTAWTNVAPDGSVMSTQSYRTCNQWTSYDTRDRGSYGDTGGIDAQWTSHKNEYGSCRYERSLYCFEQ